MLQITIEVTSYSITPMSQPKELLLKPARGLHMGLCLIAITSCLNCLKLTPLIMSVMSSVVTKKSIPAVRSVESDALEASFMCSSASYSKFKDSKHWSRKSTSMPSTL